MNVLRPGRAEGVGALLVGEKDDHVRTRGTAWARIEAPSTAVAIIAAAIAIGVASRYVMTLASKVLMRRSERGASVLNVANPARMIPTICVRASIASGSRSASLVLWLLPASPSRWKRSNPGPLLARLPPRALVDEYCVSCHDEDKKKGGLSLEAVAALDVARHPDVWENRRKLRARQMPPVGKERPDDST